MFGCTRLDWAATHLAAPVLPTRAKTISTTSLARFAFPVDPFLTEVVARDHVPPVPRRKATDMVVFRNQGRVWRAELDGNEASVLRALHAGKPLGKP